MIDSRQKRNFHLFVAMQPSESDGMNGDGEDGPKLLKASSHGSGCSSLPLQDLRKLDLSQKVEQASFLLHDGSVLHCDRRVLMARWDYFRTMIESGYRESKEYDGVLDLTADASVRPKAFGELTRT